MSSGYSVDGTTGRCYPFWVDFVKCAVNSENKWDCWEVKEDYLECLHHRKEFARFTEIAHEQERQKQEAERARKDAKNAK
mmetsp:Transcript_8950/g.19001  ORF Transcript_8950/g.19001 Transcript_8950/m.19001 type:complete len:80 (+) Transcript_8950:76-315(+)|eukprot:CAMPEP_0185846332 /NCGR_PEP_ID=MMETSP1354-20130828/2010_1 /TAXON_ID=708628 /ORGANISM="Erythrolobus madagascarensis, Strain CCMP3276" /LENGTH=79 /DNA_ID=CAMNT_0028546451 /DNA_START=59 /DNA_END=298 /DNA_ORIENTATION=+